MSRMEQCVLQDSANNNHPAGRDAELISSALSGSSDAFAELQRLYSRPLYRMVLRITRSPEDTEDVLQDTFLQAYLALRSFEGRSGVYYWFRRIAINSSLMLLRKRRNHPEVFFGHQIESENDGTFFEPKDPRLNPEQICDQHQRCKTIQQAIDQLQPKLREPLRTRMIHGTPLDEIARTLDITEAAVKSRLFRARARLSSARTVQREAGERPRSSMHARCEHSISRTDNGCAATRAAY